MYFVLKCGCMAQALQKSIERYKKETKVMPLSKISATAMQRALHELLFPTIYYDPEAELYTLRPIVFSQNVWADKTACEAFVNHIHLQDYILCDNTTAYRETAFAVMESLGKPSAGGLSWKTVCAVFDDRKYKMESEIQPDSSLLLGACG